MIYRLTFIAILISAFLCLGAGQNNPLDSVKLLGTIVESDSTRSLAVIKNKSSEQLEFYKIGDKLLGYQVARILRGEIVLLKNGKAISLSFSAGNESQPFVEVSSDVRIVNLAAASKKVPDINTAFQQAIPLPVITSGKITGLRVTNVKDKSLAAQAGIKEGDVVLSVNNQNVDSIQKALATIHQIQDEQKVNVQVKRGNEIKNLIYYVN